MAEGLFHLAYLGPGGPEFMIVMLVLLVMFGAKDAPRILRKLNEIINNVRNTADGFKREVMYGDIHSNHTSNTTSPDDYAHDYDHEDDYDYGADFDDDNEEAERDYSEETFQNLEKDLEAAEPVTEEPVAEAAVTEDAVAEDAAVEPVKKKPVSAEPVEEDDHDR